MTTQPNQIQIDPLAIVHHERRHAALLRDIQQAAFEAASQKPEREEEYDDLPQWAIVLIGLVVVILAVALIVAVVAAGVR